MNSIVSKNGNVTIPANVCKKLGLTVGTSMEFTAVEGRLVGVKMTGNDVFKSWRGRGQLPEGLDQQSYTHATRTLIPDEPRVKKASTRYQKASSKTSPKDSPKAAAKRVQSASKMRRVRKSKAA